MESHEQTQEPEIYMPTEAATALAPDGKKLAFFTVPQMEVMIKQVTAARPTEYSYRWGYHPGHKVHVLLFGWPTGQGAGLAIPEGTGDMILQHLLGVSDIYITAEPVQERLQGNVAPEEIDQIRLGSLYLPEVKFKPEVEG